VVFQFTVSIVLIVGTLIVKRQLNYIQDKNLGFQKEQLVIVKKTDDLAGGLPAFKQELLNRASIVGATNTGNLIGGNFGNSVFKIAGATGEENHLLWTSQTDVDFVKTYGIEMAAGRFFEEGRPGDLQAVVLNEAAARELGLADPVGKPIIVPGPAAAQTQTFTIIGVMKNFNFESLHRPIRPMIVGQLGPKAAGRFVTVRIRPENIRETMDDLERTWKKFSSNQAFEYEFFDSYFARIYQAEQRTASIFLYFSIFAIIIASLGLFGLASFVAEQRTREIGVRKVFGASVSNIVYLLSRQFTQWILLGNLVGWPVAYFFMRKWLQRFAYQAGISLWSFLAALLLVLAIAIFTVSYQTVKAATRSPANSLKYE